ncbi:MAG: hypothetical protein E6K29_18230 [Gammaproteobacteria bacterium]|nr:MAG: hypothetical protein E6K29_18230 [Gammaproteobacteria bacterium]
MAAAAKPAGRLTSSQPVNWVIISRKPGSALTRRGTSSVSALPAGLSSCSSRAISRQSGCAAWMS